MTTGRIPSIEGGIQPTIFDAKADILTATAADTPARLAVGANGTVLTADSSTPTGLAFAAPGGGGKVLQVVNATHSTSTLIASATFTDSGLTASITPSAATSKILVIIGAQVGVYRNAILASGRLRLVRGATAIFNDGATDNGITVYVAGGGTTGNQVSGWQSFSYLDSPNTTSSTTYKLQGRAETVANSGSILFQEFSNSSTITLMEIGA